MTWRAVQLPNQVSSITGKRIHIVAIAGYFTPSLSSKIVGDTAIAILKKSDLTIEHPAVKQKTVRENDGLISSPLILVVEFCAIAFDERHESSPFVDKLPVSMGSTLAKQRPPGWPLAFQDEISAIG